MSYLALARQWRPRTFSQLIGQEHVSQALINSLQQNRLHHAYLFTGTRGVGKTSVARLFAKALNCEQGISAEPCLQCKTCLDIEQGCFVDLIEIDAASKTRVEDTRELLENVQYATHHGRFKIYLIDEVHMLSTHSFNALLKTLEEPPSHVKFLLATTDPQKLPLTILSRCLQFNLKPLSAELIAQQLQTILNQEKRLYEQEALLIIANAANGSMRDALSILDQVLVSTQESIQAPLVKSVLAYTQQDFPLLLLNALSQENGVEIIRLSRQIAEEGGHFSYVLNALIHALHDITLQQILPTDNPLLKPNHEIQKLAQEFSAEDIQLYYQIALKGSEELSLAPTLALGFEMTLLRMLTFRPVNPTSPPPLRHETRTPEAQSQSDEAQSLKQKNPTAKSIAAENHAQVMPVDRPLSKLATASEVQGDKARRTEVYIEIHEDSNTVSTQQFADVVALRKRSNAQELPNTEVKNELAQVKPVKIEQIPAEPAQKSSHEETWDTLLPQLGLTGMARTAAENASLISQSDNEMILGIQTGHQSLFIPSVMARIQEALSNHTQRKIKLTLRTGETSNSASPSQKKQIKQQLRHNQAEKTLQEDTFLQDLEKKFSAKMLVDSISHSQDDL